MFLKKGGKKIKGKERRVSIWKRFKQIKGQHWCEHIPPLITFLYKQQLRYAHALIGTNSRGKNASCRHRRRTCTFVLFLENHAHYSIKYFLIDRSLPLPVSFIHWLYAILIIQEEITRILSKSLHFLFFSFSFSFSLFLYSTRVCSNVQHRRGISKDNGLIMATVRFEDEKKRGLNNIYIYMHRIMHLSGREMYCSIWCKLFFPRWEHNTVRLGRWPSLQWTYNSHEETDAPATRRIIGYT